MTSPFQRFFSRVLPLTILLLFCASGLSGGRLTLLPVDEFEAEAEEELDEKPGADEWFNEQRAYPLKSIPLGARARAIEQLDALETRQQLRRRQLYGKAAAELVANSQPQWEAIGPRPIGPIIRANAGRATAIALDPGYDGVNNQTLYLGAAQGGVWKTTNNGVTWQPIFDDQPSLAIGSIAVDPNNPQVLFAGTGEGNGSSDSYYGAGLFKSTDGGASWRVIPGPISTVTPRVPSFTFVSIRQIVFDPVNSQTLYLCTGSASTYGASGGGTTTGVAPGQRGIWKSTDGGETWRNLDPTGTGGTLNANEMILNPQTPDLLIVGLERNGLYRSTAGGEPGTWQRLTAGLPASDWRRIALADGPPLAPATARTLYTAISMASNTNSLHGVYRSVDNGDSWSQVSTPPSVSQPWYNLTLAVNPVNANLVYCGLVSFYRSADGGQTWQNQTSGSGGGPIHVDQHHMAIVKNQPNLFFIANDGGIWRSENANDTNTTMSWVTLNATLSTVQFQGVAVHPTDPNFLVGGTQDNGTLRFTGDPAWLSIFGGDGGFALIDQTFPNIVWQSTQNQGRTSTQNSSFGPRVSTNSGNSFTDRGCRSSCQAVPGSMNPTDRVGFYSPMAQHTGFTQASNVVYWGTQRVYRTADLGQTWTGLGPSTDGFGQDLTKGSGRVTAITAHPKLDATTDPPGEIVWAGTSDGNVQVTANAGRLANAVFTDVTTAPLPNRFVTSIAVDPNDPKHAYVAYSGFNLATPVTPGHVFATHDMGQTWHDISGDLPDVPVTAVEVDPMQAGTLYIGTDLGVFQTTDGGASWVRLSNGMPRVATFVVRYHAATRSLVVATHGRGIFRLKLAPPVITVSAASFKREALAVESIASAFGTGLATRNESATTLPLPTMLAGTTVRMTDVNGIEHLAPLFFVSPQQVNYQIPPEVAPGTVTVTITSGDGLLSFGIERVREVAPAIFTANTNGRGVPAGYGVRVREGVQTGFPIARVDSLANPPWVTEPIDLGPAGDQVVLVFFGTGLRRRTALSAVQVTIGGLAVPPDFAGAVPGLIGLDQLNFLVPRSLIGRGEVDVTIVANGVAANTVRVQIQ